MNEAPSDTSAIDSSGWAYREIHRASSPRTDKFQVVFQQGVLDEIHLHGQGSPEIEVCGVLVGQGFVDDRGPYLLIEAAIRGNGATSRSTNVTFTAEVWQHIQATMDRDYPNQKIIGWYHTHPGFGIFLSDMDVFICQNFFNLPWQVAFVYDPHSGEEGNFIWKNGKPEREEYLYEDNVTPIAASVPMISKTDAMIESNPPKQTDQLQNAKLVELLTRVKRLEQRQKFLFFVIAFITTFAVIWIAAFTPMTGGVITPAAAPTSQPTTVPAKR